MSTKKETTEIILAKLGHSPRFSARPMFGEYGFYADDKIIGGICDDQLFIKILPASAELEAHCHKGPPYPGAKLQYIVTETQLSTLPNLAELFFALATSIPVTKKKAKKSSKV